MGVLILTTIRVSKIANVTLYFLLKNYHVGLVKITLGGRDIAYESYTRI